MENHDDPLEEKQGVSKEPLTQTELEKTESAKIEKTLTMNFFERGDALEISLGIRGLDSDNT